MVEGDPGPALPPSQEYVAAISECAQTLLALLMDIDIQEVDLEDCEGYADIGDVVRTYAMQDQIRAAEWRLFEANVVQYVFQLKVDPIKFMEDTECIANQRINQLTRGM